MRQVQRLAADAGAAAAEEAELCEVRLSWTDRVNRIEDVDIGPGQYVAMDVTILQEVGDMRYTRTVERLTNESWDLGIVRDAEGQRIGVITRVDGNYYEWARDDGEPA